MSKARQDYLQKKWIKYPTTPSNVLAIGRAFQGKLDNIEIFAYKACDASQYEARDVLVDGDLIAVLPDKKFALLAPNLTVGEQDLSRQSSKIEKHQSSASENDLESFKKSVSTFINEIDPIATDLSGIFNKWQKIKRWNLFLREIRYFFDRKNFLQMSTPTLVICPGTEPSLDPFKTQFVWGKQKKDFYLPTSPELNLKKILSIGASAFDSQVLAIYEIAKVFRNGEETERHLPEFHMLEWYRPYASLDSIKEDVIQVIYAMAEYLSVEKPTSIKVYSVAELFKIHCDFNLTPQTSINEFKQLAKKMNVDILSAEVIDDYFHLIFSEKIEPFLSKSELIFVEKYPPYQAALARCDCEGWAERFEVYWKGLELANAFHELNDPKIQRQRSLADLEKKRVQGREKVSLDENFFKALEYGMPPSSGIALGLERLYMALTDVNDIKELLI